MVAVNAGTRFRELQRMKLQRLLLLMQPSETPWWRPGHPLLVHELWRHHERSQRLQVAAEGNEAWMFPT